MGQNSESVPNVRVVRGIWPESVATGLILAGSLGIVSACSCVNSVAPCRALVWYGFLKNWCEAAVLEGSENRVGLRFDMDS
jgi:hypothetical protein